MASLAARCSQRHTRPKECGDKGLRKPMLTPDRLKSFFEASVSQELGHWLENHDSDLGWGVFAWHGEPTLQVYELGLVYGGDRGWRVRFDQVVDLKSLDLRELMLANKNPELPVDVSIITAASTLDLRIHLYHYTTLASVLYEVVRPEKS